MSQVRYIGDRRYWSRKSQSQILQMSKHFSRIEVFDNDVKFIANQQHREDVRPVRIPAIILRVPRDVQDCLRRIEIDD